MGDQPLLRFGLLTDIQHADKDIVYFDERPQRYRESAGKLQQAVEHLSTMHSSGQAPLEFVLTLGDIVDGYPAGDSSAASKTSRDLQQVAGIMDAALQLPVYHALGNHCLAARRSELLQVLRMPSSYYSVGHGWKLVVLDTTDMSGHSGYPQDSDQAQQAHQWLEAHPVSQYPNAEPWNGGLTSQQLAWLQQELTDAAAAGQQVMLACHHPLAPGSAPAQYLAWKYDVILGLLEAPGSTVRLVLSGHYHPGGYVQRGCVHYVVFEGILEVPSDSNAYGVVSVWSDRVCIQGYGKGSSRTLLLA